MKPFLILLALPFWAYAQPNCNVFLWNGDTAQYRACEFVELHKNDYYQFDWRQMALWEEAITICPYFAYPHCEKAAPYIKAGNFVEWKKNIDKAVQYAPLDYLSRRASNRYKFFADYQGTLDDLVLLEELMRGEDIGPTSNGMYHLNIVKGLCLKALGNNQAAIEAMETQMKHEDHFVGLYDHLHLGVLYLEEGMLDKALTTFAAQTVRNDIAENRYYMALAYKKMDQIEAYEKNIVQAVELYKNRRRMNDPYNELFDQIYWSDLEAELENINQ